MEEELIKRILPHSDDAERSVIGCMMMNREAIMIASEILTGDEFYRQQMGIVFDSMVELYNEGKPVDFVTLPEKLKEKDVPPEISSMEFAKDLLTAVPTSVNVGHYAKIVKEKAMLRRLIKMNEDIANTCYLDKEPVEEIMEDTEKQLFQLLQTRTGGDYVPIRQVVLNALETIEKASQTKGTVTGIPTGFVDLDYKTSGLQPSDLLFAPFTVTLFFLFAIFLRGGDHFSGLLMSPDRFIQSSVTSFFPLLQFNIVNQAFHDCLKTFFFCRLFRSSFLLFFFFFKGLLCQKLPWSYNLYLNLFFLKFRLCFLLFCNTLSRYPMFFHLRNFILLMKFLFYCL